MACILANIISKRLHLRPDTWQIPSGNIKELIKEIGSERVLFGRDYPFVTQALSILSVLRATDDEQERINIFSKNAKTLLGI